METSDNGVIRTFATGATRTSSQGKLDFEGFLSPLVLKRYAEYLDKHRLQADGKLRDSDNWQRGMGLDVYMKSCFRHFMDMWAAHRGAWSTDQEEAICAVLFNAMGYLHEALKQKQEPKPAPIPPEAAAAPKPKTRDYFTTPELAMITTLQNSTTAPSQWPTELQEFAERLEGTTECNIWQHGNEFKCVSSHVFMNGMVGRTHRFATMPHRLRSDVEIKLKGTNNA